MTGQACVNSGIFHCLPFNSSDLYYHQTPTRRYGHASTPPRSLPITGHRNMYFRRLWNGMFDRHRAEITVMQFTGHSLPAHHFVTAPWHFYLVPYCQPSYILHSSPSYFTKCSLVNILSEYLSSLPTPHKRSNCTTWVCKSRENNKSI